MAYQDSVQQLCDELGIQNPIPESDLSIAQLIFTNAAGEIHTVDATEMNRAGRLFIEDIATTRFEYGGGPVARATHLVYGEPMRTGAKQFFSEIWEGFSPTRRTLLYGIAAYDEVEIIWK